MWVAMRRVAIMWVAMRRVGRTVGKRLALLAYLLLQLRNRLVGAKCLAEQVCRLAEPDEIRGFELFLALDQSDSAAELGSFLPEGEERLCGGARGGARGGAGAGAVCE